MKFVIKVVYNHLYLRNSLYIFAMIINVKLYKAV